MSTWATNDGRAALSALGHNLSAEAMQGHYVPLATHDTEVRQLIAILARARGDPRHKHNPILVGEPSNDRFAIIAEVVRRIAVEPVHMQLQACEVWALDLEAVLVRAPLSEAQEQLLRLLSDLRGSVGRVILFVDDFHRLVGGHSKDATIDIGPFLKTALGRGELQLLGTASLVAYQHFIEADAALERRVQPVVMHEDD